MHRRTWLYVTNSQHQIVFINDLRRDFARGNLFEQRLAHDPLRPQQTTRAQSAARRSLSKQVRKYSTIWSLSDWHPCVQRRAPSNCFTQRRNPPKCTMSGASRIACCKAARNREKKSNSIGCSESRARSERFERAILQEALGPGGGCDAVFCTFKPSARSARSNAPANSATATVGLPSPAWT